MIKPPLATPIASVLIASLLVQPSMMMAGPGVESSSTETTVSRELIRRQARERIAQEEIIKGKAAYAAKDYEAAFAHFKNACENLAEAPATEDTREDAVEGLTKSGIKLAEQRVTEGYYASAVQILQVVLIYNPNDKATLKLLANIEAPDYFNKRMTPGHRANVETVKQLFLDADNYTQLGRYNMALRKYEEILNKDPDNIAARKGRGEVYRLKTQGADAAYDAARAQSMYEVTSQWERPYRRFDRRAIELRSETRDTRPNTIKITKKLNEIILPRVDFRETTVREAIEFLVQKSKQLDPESQGVNIVLKLDDQGGVSAPPPPAPGPAGGIPGLPDAGAGAVPPTGGPIVTGGAGTRVTLNLNNVPLMEVINYIANLANLKVKIEPYSVLILPIGVSTDEMYIREWKVSPAIFRSSMGGATALGAADPAAPAAPASSLATSTNAKDFLQQSGVTFNQGALAMYSPATSTLVVKNTQDQLDLVERVIEVSIHETAIKQIEIQAKFVEITQNNLKELSFDWLLGQSNVPGISTQSLFTSGGTSGTSPQLDPNDFPFQIGGRPIGNNPLTAGNRSGNLAISANAIDALLFGGAGATRMAPGVFALTGVTDPSFQVVMRGLDQKKGVDLLSAPRVTTRSGNRAVIEIIREFRYPIEFEQPQIPQTFGNTNGGTTFLPTGGGGINPLAFNSNGSFPVTPTTPTTFETRNTGVTLEVEPVIGPDGASIDMQLAPQVVEFEGFINYGSPIQTTATNALGQTQVNVITPNVINQPIFSTRKVSTNVTVFDGATVVLGGLVREDVQKVEDKTPIVGDIPLLGRLFRSNVDQHIKRNLVIFVTARIINAEGQPIAGDDEKEEIVEELPLPEQPMPLPDLGGFSKDSRRLK